MENKKLLVNAGVFVAGAGIGFGVGYLVFKKKYQAIAESEIESVREAYAKNAKPKPDLTEIRSTYVIDREGSVLEQDEVIANEGYFSVAEETDADAFLRAHGRVPTTYELIQMGNGIEPSEAKRDLADGDDVNIPEGNIFEGYVEPDPQELAENADEVTVVRTPDRPYVISSKEWYTNDTDYDQITLTYWADDDVLADDTNRMINEVDEVVGATNLHRFGFLSEDPDIVYVRNERLKADYEITKDERNYSEIVHGIPVDADKSGVPRRMRSNEE